MIASRNDYQLMISWWFADDGDGDADTDRAACEVKIYAIIFCFWQILHDDATYKVIETVL